MRTQSSVSLLDNATADERFTDIPPELPRFREDATWHPLPALFAYLTVLLLYFCLLVFSFLDIVPLCIRAHRHELLASLNVPLLLLTGMLQRHLANCSQVALQDGFLEHAQRMQERLHLPFVSVAYCSAAVLLEAIWPLVGPSGSLVLHATLAVELVVVMTSAYLCLRAELQHRAENGRPDAYVLLTSPLMAAEEGCSGEKNSLVERQALLLRCQHETLRQLSFELLRLQEIHPSVRVLGRNSEEDVDYADLLAARDQEVRMLAAEIEQLQGEIQLARSHASDLQDATQLLRENNTKFAEEDARLRLMLEEWSHYAARLESALESQRSEVLDLRQKLNE